MPVTINQGYVMPAWYDIVSADFERKADEAGVRKSAARIEGLLKRERQAGIASERIVLAGFSQGGAIAMHLGLRYHEPLAGLLLLSTYMACDGNLDSERSVANSKVPVFQGHGTQDPMVTIDRGIRARDRMQQLGHEVTWKQYPMQHQVVPAEIEDVGKWLRATLA